MKDKLGISRTDDLKDLLNGGLCSMAFQPILELQSKKIHGFEALLRGSNGTSLPNPDILFNREGYLDNEILLRLDTACVGSALRSGRELARHTASLSISISPPCKLYLFILIRFRLFSRILILILRMLFLKFLKRPISVLLLT